MKFTKAALAAGATLALASMTLTGCSNFANSDKNNSDGQTYNVGVVQLVQHDALDAATKGFQDKLTELIEADGKKVTFDVQDAGGESTNAATIANGFVSDNVDLIMANATPALQAASEATTTIPVVGTSVTEYGVALDLKDFDGKTGINVTGTSDLAPLDKQAEIFSELLPNVKNVGILYSSAEANSVYQAEKMQELLEGKGITVKAYTVADTNEIAAVAKTAVDEMDALYIPTDNTVASAAATVDEVAAAANKPVIAGEEGICEGTGLATLSISYYDLGAKTAEMAYEILVNNADPSTMEISYVDTATKKYVPARAEKLGVTIPEGYEAIEVSEEK